jgi:hypothetical protein
MKKTNSIELTKWLAWSTFAAICLGYAAIWSLDTIWSVPDGFYSILPSVLVTINFHRFYSRQLERLDSHLPVKEKTGLRATNSRAINVNSSGGTKQVFLSTVQGIFGSNEKEAQQPKSMLWWEFGPYIIYEDTVYEWLRKGWNRQLAGEAHPFSCNWMIKQRFYSLSSQCIERTYHEALVDLTLTYGLWLKPPRQGVAGKLRVSPLGCISKMGGRW